MLEQKASAFVHVKFRLSHFSLQILGMEK